MTEKMQMKSADDYGLLSMRRERFERLMRDSAGQVGRVGLVRKPMFLRHGVFVARVERASA